MHFKTNTLVFKPTRPVYSIALLLSLSLAGSSQAQLTSTRVGSGFTAPIFATYAPGDANTLYVVQQGGLVRPMNINTGVIGSTFLNLTSFVPISSGGEQGLLGLAFDPNYATNNRFFVYYNDSAGNIQIDRFTTTAGVPGSRTPILNIPHPGESNHNGGWMGFSPTDGFLYVGVGDGGSGNDPPNNAQNRNNLLGKMLRLDVSGATYTSPASNPFASGGGRPEIWSYGLRNPFRNSFDRANGNLYIADVGQGQREEINFQASSATALRNYGWRQREGRIATPGISDPPPVLAATEPIYDYDHGIGRSVTGGYVYRGTPYLDGGVPLEGTYMFADFITQRIFSFRYTGSDIATNAATERTSELVTSTNGFTINGISSFGEDLAGNLYIVDYGGGSAGAGEIFVIRGVAVPEPASIAMIGLAAAAGLGYYRHRRRSNQRDMVIEG